MLLRNVSDEHTTFWFIARELVIFYKGENIGFNVKENGVCLLEPLGNFVKVVESPVISNCDALHTSHLLVKSEIT